MFVQRCFFLADRLNLGWGPEKIKSVLTRDKFYLFQMCAPESSCSANVSERPLCTGSIGIRCREMNHANVNPRRAPRQWRDSAVVLLYYHSETSNAVGCMQSCSTHPM